MAAQRSDHVGPDGEVRHEMPVHHVDVDPVGAGRFHRAHLLAELGEIGGKDRGGDKQRTHRILRHELRVTRGGEAGNATWARARAIYPNLSRSVCKRWAIGLSNCGTR